MKFCAKSFGGPGWLVLAASLALPVNCRAADLAIGTFGRTNYGDWTLTGTAFNPGPAADNLLFGKLEIENALRQPGGQQRD